MQIMIRNRNNDIIQQQKGRVLCQIFIAYVLICSLNAYLLNLLPNFLRVIF